MKFFNAARRFVSNTISSVKESAAKALGLVAAPLAGLTALAQSGHARAAVEDISAGATTALSGTSDAATDVAVIVAGIIAIIAAAGLIFSLMKKG